MGKIIVSLNVSLDGVAQDPDGTEGFRRGGWFGQSGGKMPLRLLDTRTIGDGLVFLTYEVVREA
jgi:hypothetical protein